MSLKIVLQTIPIILLVLLVLAILIPACAPKPDTAARVSEYREALSVKNGTEDDNPRAIRNFCNFLQKIGDKKYIEENTSKVYAPDAYLNDTLVTHRGPEEIKAYFLETSETMETYEVTIDDTVSSGQEHYIRWTMIFTAPALNGGKPVESIGISHVRLNPAGQVVMHQDFWDSGTNIYGQLPVLGGMIETIRRRFEK
ncbi:nuclear transport factor 2 family protein [Luteolibacter sp. AS25]|uniref:nuclear transport factor 2 family protein n=1 Tax=Luteolibacter sp. AS25 TaxID=3135776 RepID=UPI00398B1818